MDFPILVTNKEKLNNYLLLNNIETKYLFYHNCAKIFGNKKEFKIQKNGKYFSDHVIGLPNHKKISKTYMNKIAVGKDVPFDATDLDYPLKKNISNIL